MIVKEDDHVIEFEDFLKQNLWTNELISVMVKHYIHLFISCSW